MNIAIWNPRVGHATAGGTETFLREMATRLAADHTVTLYTDIRPDEQKPVAGVEYHPVRSWRKEGQRHTTHLPLMPAELESLTMWRHFDGDLRGHDVVSTHYYLDALVLRGVNPPLVYRYPGIKQPNWRWRLFHAVDPADAYIANSRATADRLARWYGARPAHTVYAGVDTDAFRNRGETIPQRCLFVGRLDRGKGLFRLLDAIAGVADARLRIVGDGVLRDALQRRIAELGLGDRVTLVGRVPHSDMPREYARASIVVQPTDHEGFSITVLEALAAGTPVIASDIDATRQQLTDGVTGLLVPPGDVPALQAAIAEVLAHPIRRQDMALAARHSAHQFDWATQATALEAVYRGAA